MENPGEFFQTGVIGGYRLERVLTEGVSLIAAKGAQLAIYLTRPGLLHVPGDETVCKPDRLLQKTLYGCVQAADPYGFEPSGDLMRRVHGFVVVLTGQLVYRRIRVFASLGDILHGMAELGERVDVSGVLVHHPGLAAGRLHHVHGLEESGDVGGTVQAVGSFRRSADHALALR